MAESNATILIPDISGFTEFMTTTELSHSTFAINMLIDAILKAVNDEYEVIEIEGDAVLLIRKGPAPSQKEIVDICIRLFNAFHFQRKYMEQYTICPCGACRALVNLTLKFVAHHGPLAEIRVGGFVKPSGPEMIVAHRLLKNSIRNNEYLLMTDKLLAQSANSAEEAELEWLRSSEEYPSIGKVDYYFTLLNKARANVPEPPGPYNQYRTDNTPYFEISIAADFRDVYMKMMDIPERPKWMAGLQKVEQHIPDVFIGSIHQCTFEEFETTVSPLRMTVSEHEIIYAESCRIDLLNISLVNEFIFTETGVKECRFDSRFLNAGEWDIPDEVNNLLSLKLKKMAESLKESCENNSMS